MNARAITRLHCQEVWMALGGDPVDFEHWMAEPRRTLADAWSQLLQAIRDPQRLTQDTNPPAGNLLYLALRQPIPCGHPIPTIPGGHPVHLCNLPAHHDGPHARG